MIRLQLTCALFVPLLAAQTVYPPGQAVRPGVLPQTWTTGGPRCVELPEWQVHEYNEDFYILRESGCVHYEKPFLYLIFGAERALLVDTGAGKIDVAGVVTTITTKWLARQKREGPLPLTVVHSHGHGDHTAGDKQFEAKPGVTVIPAKVDSLKNLLGFKSHPTDVPTLDLGQRMVDVIAIPGHEEASIALYDRQTGILLSGDTLYPGRLYVRDWAAYAASAQRLADFTSTRVVTHILGAHIEQARTPFRDYDRGTAYQPDEHELALSRAHLLEWNDALRNAKGVASQIALRDFTIVPPRPPQPPAEAKSAGGQ